MRQAFERLNSLCPPAEFADWDPTDEQLSVYKEFLNKVLNHHDNLVTLSKWSLLQDAAIAEPLPEANLRYLSNVITPLVPELERIFQIISPSDFSTYVMLKEIFVPSGGGGKVRGTFEVGIEQVRQIIDDNPGQEFWFQPYFCKQVIDSPLIGFNPDAWLDRVGRLNPLRIVKADWLNQQIKRRLIELYRVYIFGCPFSVSALARSILEYSILDNVTHLGISPTHPQRSDGRKIEKSLAELEEEVGKLIPRIIHSMDVVRRAGNDYLHPKPSKESKASLFEVDARANDVVSCLLESVEALYLYRAA